MNKYEKTELKKWCYTEAKQLTGCILVVPKMGGTGNRTVEGYYKDVKKKTEELYRIMTEEK